VVFPKNNVMESISIGLPSTPTRANSAGPSPPRRNLMEDADSSVTRKRPRLDSGERTRRSMSADPLNAASSSVEASQPFITPRRGEPFAGAARENAIFTLNDRTPSKVTINVRDPVQTTSPSALAANGAHILAVPSRDEAPDSDLMESSVKIESQTSEVISVASTPTRSPEIEVAEVEDITEEPGQTKWRPLATNVMDAKDLQETLMKKFPYTNGGRDVRDTVRLLGQAFEKRKLAILQIKVRVN
jgi:ubiquitin carboxyl-terminal hydrolase 34